MTLKQVCEEYYNIVYRRCLRDLFYNQELASEVTQQTFLVLCEKWSSLCDHPNLEGWLLVTAEYKIKKAKELHTKNPYTICAEDEDFVEPTNENEIFEQVICEHLDNSLEQYEEKVYEKLNKREQILFRHLRSGKKHADIAELMGCKKGAVSVAAVRLSRKIRSLVKEIVDDIL